LPRKSKERERERQHPRKKKRRRRKRQHLDQEEKKKYWRKPMCKCTWAYFLVGLGRKQFGSTIILFSPSPNQTLSKKISSYFIYLFFHPP